MYQQKLLWSVVDYNDLIKQNRTKEDDIYKKAILRWNTKDTLSEDLYILAARLMVYSDETTRKTLILACLEARNRIRMILKEIKKNPPRTLAYSAKEVQDAYNFFLSVILTIQEEKSDIRIYKKISRNIAVLDYLESVHNNQTYDIRTK